MKKIFTILAAVSLMTHVFAQSPQKMSYQAVVRNSSNILITSTTVGMRLSILQGSLTGTAVYVETQSPPTNANGLVSLEIGGGTVVSGTFAAIDWANGLYFIKTETDPLGGTNYTITGTSQLLSVPYSLHSKTAESIFGGITETDPIFVASPANGIVNTNITNWNIAFGWGNHATVGYLTSFTENDPIWSAASVNYYTSTNMQTSGSAQLHFNNIINKPTTISGYGITDAFDGNYNSLTNKPTLFDGTWTSLTGKPTFATVATSGSYTDLLNLPALFNGDYNNLSNKPILFSGNYNDLTNQPTLFDGNYNSLTGAPTNVSSFTNDAGYLTAESQALSIGHDTIYLSNGGFVKLPTYGNSGSTLPSVITVNTTNINYTSASANSNITNNGNELILTRGVCLSKNASPDLNDTVYYSGSGSGSFTTNCNPLATNTTYHVRSFATNSVGTSYGNELSFTTKTLTVPTISTQTISTITNTTAIAGGNITDDGGTSILVRGICWSLSSNPTTADNFTTEGVGAGSYISLMTGLTSNTLYHVRAYATNAQGTSYGNDLSFTTIVLQLASVTTAAASSISYTTATSGGNVTTDNGSSVTSRGICWATTTSPTTSNSNYSQAGGLGTFTANMTGLTANTTYYVRSFAINGGGTSYGNQISFTTLTPSVATLTTNSISGISSNIAGSGGTITTEGGSAITAKGVCWSLNPAPTIANSKTTDGTGSANFNSTMNGLNPLTQYYVRAYATNGLGTAYGNEINFTTSDLVNPGPTVPVVGTSASSITGSSTASSGGYVSSDGGSSITVRGHCWSTSTTPTLADNFSTDGGTGTGYFSSTITGLSGCGTVYYIRAYATNSTGTGYGNQNTVSTGLLPIVTTDEVSSIDYYTAVSGGSITDNGGCPITQKGVCWNYNTAPTISNSKTIEGAGSSAFVSNITGLTPNRTYYVRAYATNSVGTVYGPEKIFTTETPSTLYIGQNYAGGIIFYLDGTGLHGLACTSADQGGQPSWGCDGTVISSTGTAIGTGASNTAIIVASCGESNIPAKICDDLVLSGYSDWFLPSSNELSLLYSNLKAQGLGNFTGRYYWGSTSNSSGTAWGEDFYYGSTGNYGKYNYFYVRPVRAF